MAELFRFRCSECQKLLGVSQRKVGRAIACPSCGAELIVPSPDDAPDAADDDETADFPALGIDLGYGSSLTIQPTPRVEPVNPDEAEALAFLARAAATPADNADASPPRFLPFDDPAHLDDLTNPPDDADADENEDEDDPLIQTPTEPLVPRRRGDASRLAQVAAHRRHDVVLPQTAVTAWALFAILALGMSFAAGLLIGHYRWR